MSETKPKEKEGWYPGKYIKRKSVATSSPSGKESPATSSSSSSSFSSTSTTTPISSPTSSEDKKEVAPTRRTSASSEAAVTSPSSSSSSSPTPSSSSSSHSKEGWYPGKLIGVKPPTSSSKNRAFIRNKFPIAGKPPVKSVGNVIVKVLGVKYMSATRPSFEVWLGKQLETFHFLGLEQDGSCNEEFEGFFSLGDLTSDITIIIKEDYSVEKSNTDEENFIGRVVIPLSSYLSMKSRLPPKKEWMAVYPVINPKNPMEKFEAGLNALPGSAMPKSKQSLGFVCVQVELLIPEGPVYNQYLEGEPPQEPQRLTSTEAAGDNNLSEKDVNSDPMKKVDPEKFYRVCLRLQQFFSGPPALIAPALKFPEVFVLIALYWFLCFGASAVHLPLIFFFVVALNGFLSKRDFQSSVTLWNEMLEHDNSVLLNDPHSGKALPFAVKRSPDYIEKHLQGPLHGCQVYIAKLVNFLEVSSNIWNFSDIRVSAVFYGIFGVIALLSTLVLIIFSIRVLFFMIGTALLLLNSLGDVFPELFCLEKLYTMTSSGESEDKLQPVRNVFTKFWLALSRVPNERMLVHRYIARSCIVDEDGEEMKDAAVKLKNM